MESSLFQSLYKMKAKGTELIFVNEIDPKSPSGHKEMKREEVDFFESLEEEFDLVNYPGSKVLFVAKQISKVANIWICDEKTNQVIHRDFSRSFAVFIR